MGGRAHKQTRAPSGRAERLADGRTGGRADGRTGRQTADGLDDCWIGGQADGGGRADDGFPKVKLLI